VVRRVLHSTCTVRDNDDEIVDPERDHAPARVEPECRIADLQKRGTKEMVKDNPCARRRKDNNRLCMCVASSHAPD